MKKFFLIAFAAVALVGCKAKKEQSTQTAKDERVAVKIEAAVTEQINLTEVFTSEILANKTNEITPAAAGVHINQIMVEVGDHVSKGQLIVKLDPTQYNQQLVLLKNYEDDYHRLLPVYEAGGITAQQLDQAKAQLDVQREVVDNLLKNINVVSPISGVVTARNYESGDLFAQQPILQIMQINPLKVVVNISEQYFKDVKIGMPVQMNVDLFPDKEFMGKVSLIHPAFDPASRTFTVEVNVSNTDNLLRPGMYARTTFNMGKKEGVMVTDIAIQKQMGSNERYLFIDKDGIAERRTVTVGRQVGEQVDIISGVEPGDKIIVSGLSKVFDGAEIKVVE